MSEQVAPSRYRLLSRVLDTLELAVDGKVAFITITDEMVKEAKATWEDTDGMVNYARALKGVDCGVLMSPAKRGGVRVSMRSKGHWIDAGQVCLELGGGGHRGAAGCTLEGELVAARKTVEDALEKAVADASAPQT
jgi:phosphoesterase RecJ-like protein